MTAKQADLPKSGVGPMERGAKVENGGVVAVAREVGEGADHHFLWSD